MNRNYRRTLLGITWLAILSAAIFMGSGCSSDSSDPTQPSTPPIPFEQIEEALIETQQMHYDRFLELVTTSADTAAALDSIQVAFALDPDVEWSVASDQGVFVKYTNGLRGGIFVEPLNGPGDPEEVYPSGLPAHKTNYGRSSDKAVKKAFFFNPHFRDRVSWSNYMLGNYAEMLPGAGFNTMEYSVNEDASVERLTRLDGYNLIHLYSHGCAFPSKENYDAVLLMTGSQLTREIFETYNDDFKNGRAACLTVKLGATVFVSAEFITHHNNLGGGKVLIYGGFCFSNLGNWPGVMEDEGVGGYFGFDWIVTSNNCNRWNISLMTDLLDTYPNKPLTTNDWMTNSVPKWYWDDRYSRPVSIDYIGNPKLTLLDSAPTPCEDSATGGVSDGYVKAYGNYFTLTPLEDPVQVKYVYKKIHCDGSVGTAGPYYGTTREDGSFSSPMTAILSLGNHQEQVIVEVTIRGYTRRAVIEYDDFFDGMTGATLITPRRVQFNFGY